MVLKKFQILSSTVWLAENLQVSVPTKTCGTGSGAPSVTLWLESAPKNTISAFRLKPVWSMTVQQGDGCRPLETRLSGMRWHDQLHHRKAVRYYKLPDRSRQVLPLATQAASCDQSSVSIRTPDSSPISAPTTDFSSDHSRLAQSSTRVHSYSSFFKKSWSEPLIWIQMSAEGTINRNAKNEKKQEQNPFSLIAAWLKQTNAVCYSLLMFAAEPKIILTMTYLCP